MWQPCADISTLSRRSNILKELRSFFYSRSVSELDVPVLGAHTVTDPFLDSIQCKIKNARYFLQTSPEYFMKRALAAGAGDIFYLGRSFREDEEGRYHSPEFTMLEWYRRGFDDRRLARELIELVLTLKPSLTVVEKNYRDLFIEHCGIDPIPASAQDLRKIAHKKCKVDWDDTSKTTWLDLMFTHLVEPNLDNGLVVVFDYPKEQAALARLSKNSEGQEIARRFEVFFNGLELANGYWELCDPTEQKKRFEKNLCDRETLGKPSLVIDKSFIAALEHGLPECAGVAMGVDRLLMCLLDKEKISDVQTFSMKSI